MPPAVIDAMRDFRTALDAQEQAASLRMAESWLDITRSLDGEFDRLALEASNAAAAGRPLTLWHVSRMERYQSLMRQVGAALREFAPVAGAEVTEAQWVAARHGIDHGQQLIAMQMPGIGAQFDRLPVEAVQNMVGVAGDGAPLGRLLRASFADAAPDVVSPLIRGVALGWHPAKIAGAMRDAVNVTLDRAITISRTEVARVYREASRQTYIRSKVVDGYIRVAAKSNRTCMACLLADGTFYPLDVPFEEHVCGRCTPAPKIKNVPFPAFETGEQWFLRQDAATQRQMMGPGRYDAWQAGQFQLADLVTRVENDTWGNSLQVTPLRTLLSGSGSSPTALPSSATPLSRQIHLTYEASAQQKAVVDQHVMDQIRRFANRHGMQEAEVRSMVEDVLHELVENIPISKRQRYAYLDGVFQSGRFKSQFETGTSEGAFTPRRRAFEEEKGLGFPVGVADHERPIYGYFNISSSSDDAEWYGGLEFVFKREVRARATFTIGDSLGPFGSDRLYGSSVNAPELGSADTFVEALMEYALGGDIDDLLGEILYVEVQMQGGVQLTDAEYVIDHDNQLTPSDISKLTRLGIGVRR